MLLALLLVLVAAGSGYLLLPFRERVVARRGALRLIGEVAALALRVHDPWAGQTGVKPGGLPDREFLAAPAPDTASATFMDVAGRRRVARVTGWSSAATPTIPPFEFEYWDDPALVDLRRAERGEGFDCGSYAWTLIQVLAALGINGRLVELEGPDGWGHSVVEAWCDDQDKWVVLDPYGNATYLAGGVPLDVLELHRLRRAGREREIQNAPPPAGSRVVAWRDAPLVDPFAYVELKTTALRWRWEAADSTGTPALAVRLATCAPNFDTFLFSREGLHWTATGATLRVRPRIGRDTLRFAARNRGGRVGRVSWIALETRSLPEPAHATPLPLAHVGGRF